MAIDLGISQEALTEATGSSVTPAFELVPSGVQKAKISGAFVYVNQFGTTTLRINVALNDFSGRELTFRQDIGATLKALDDGTVPPNVAYANRLKQLEYATGVSMDNWTYAAAPVKIKVFGKDVDAQQIQGFSDKTVLALVRQSENTNASPDDQYRMSNDIEGLCAVDGTDATGENAAQVFMEKVEKNGGIFKFKGYVKKEAADTPAATAEQKSAMSNLI